MEVRYKTPAEQELKPIKASEDSIIKQAEGKIKVFF